GGSGKDQPVQESERERTATQESRLERPITKRTMKVEGSAETSVRHWQRFRHAVLYKRDVGKGCLVDDGDHKLGAVGGARTTANASPVTLLKSGSKCFVHALRVARNWSSIKYQFGHLSGTSYMAQKSASETTARGRDWTLTLAVDLPGQDSHSPLFSRIAQAVERAIRSGRLTPGTRLPGSRSLARALGVHRNTILHAYAELTAQGWLSAAPTRGTFVSTHLNTAGALDVQTPVRALRGRTPRTQSPYGLAPQ